MTTIQQRRATMLKLVRTYQGLAVCLEKDLSIEDKRAFADDELEEILAQTMCSVVRITLYTSDKAGLKRDAVLRRFTRKLLGGDL